MFKPLIEECQLRNYSKRTINTYLHFNQDFLKKCKKSPQQVTQRDVRNYLLYLINKGKSSSTVNLAHNALNFYYKTIMKRRFNDIPFQKREEKIKETLSRDEIVRLSSVLTNKKHKLIIGLLYASGVRVSELIKIKTYHLDFSRKLLLVKQGKGKKDRHTILSDSVIIDIKNYLQNRKNNSEYLFETKEGHITTRTIQEVLRQAKKKAKITKPVTPHILRHSFATHLKEKKVEDSILQKLMGHKNYKTTQTYAKVTTKDLEKVTSPHDIN